MKPLNIIRTAFELLLVLLLCWSWASSHPSQPDKNWRHGVISSVPMKKKWVAITFDDGPHPVFTPQILNVLNKYHVKATFFMIGQRMEEYPEVVREVIAQGHIIGNHTYTHPRNIDADTRGQVARELERCERVIEHLAGKRAYLFRPPRGLIDGTVFTIAEEQGYRTVLWSVCADHHDAPTPQMMADRVVKLIRPGGIILVHDGRVQSRWKDVLATSLIIEALQKRGYRFVTIPQLLPSPPWSGWFPFNF